MYKKGVVLLTVIIILLTVSVIGATLVTFFSSVNSKAESYADESKALYLAEAGISYAIYLMRTSAANPVDFQEEIGPLNLGEGSFMVKVDLLQSLITSTGIVRDAKKTVQLQYSAL